MFTEYLEKNDLRAFFVPKEKRLPIPKAADRAAWEGIPLKMREEILAAAKDQQGAEFPPLTAAQFLAFVRTGDRSAYEIPCFTRRRMLLNAMLAECIASNGAYMDQVVDGLWCICEESFWGISAHNGSSHPGMTKASERALPDIENPYIDLFAAQTAALLLWTCYLLKDKLDAVSPLVIRRVHLEAERRIVKPFFYHDDFWWMGMIRSDVNNWTPWILSNVIATLLLMETDDGRLNEGIRRAMRMLDSYLAVMPEDGGCDEGASYWNMAGGSLLDCLEHIEHLTGGQVTFYDEPHIRAIGAFPLKAHIAGPYFWNFADCDAKPMLDGERVYRYGLKTGQEGLKALGAEIAGRAEGVLPKDTPETYRVLCKLFYSVPMPQEEKQGADTVILPDLQVWASRKDGLYAAVKGGHNGENHNHNDVGSFLLYAQGGPEIVDAGNMVYTAKTFGPERYTLWNTRSMDHNVPLIADFEQQPGKSYAARNVNMEESGITLDMAAAYPKEAGVISLIRSAGFRGEAFVLTDTVKLQKAAPVTWVFMLRCRPEIAQGMLQTEKMVMRFDESLNASCEEIPVTDKRMERSFPGSLWRVALSSPDLAEQCRTFYFSGKVMKK